MGAARISNEPRRERWISGLLAVVGTFLFLFLLSPGLRTDIGKIAIFLGELDMIVIRDWILSFGAFAPVIYFLIMVGQVIVNPIPAGPVTLAGALIFGVWQGLALSMAGSVVGSILVFLAVRRWGKPLLLRFVHEETYEKYAGKLGEGGWWFFFFIMLLPVMPDDAVCALAGLSAMSFGRYVAFMVVGRLPGATLTVLLVSDTITSSMAGWIAAGIVVVVLLVLAIIYREHLESWVLRHAGAGHATSTPPGTGMDEHSKDIDVCCVD